MALKEKLTKHVYDYLVENFSGDSEDYEEGWEHKCAEEIVTDALVDAIEREMEQQFKVSIILNGESMEKYQMKHIINLPYDDGRSEMEKLNFFLDEPAVELGGRMRSWGSMFFDMDYAIYECCYLTKSGELVFADELCWKFYLSSGEHEITVDKRIVDGKNKRNISFEYFAGFIDEGYYEEFFAE